MMIRLRSLQQRMVLFLLLPVALLLVGMGLAGFFYSRNALLAQWREVAVLRLGHPAQEVDITLSRIKRMLALFGESNRLSNPIPTQSFILQSIRSLPGVVSVELKSETPAPERAEHDSEMEYHRGMMLRPFQRVRVTEVTQPRYNETLDHETVRLVSELENAADETVGSLVVTLRFDELIHTITSSGWWRSHQGYLVDDSGRILAGTTDENRRVLGENGDPLEKATLGAMKTADSGTVLGPENPPDISGFYYLGSPPRISGFYHLSEAPWSVVMLASGKDILAPIYWFRFNYLIVGAAASLVILLLIRFVTRPTVTAIEEVSRAAERVASGAFEHLPETRRADEVGHLVASFNTMVQQLQERMRIKRALDLAMEIQQNLLPQRDPEIPGLDVAGKVIYSDETGGDYFDYLSRDPERLDIVVGDVSDHGFPSALLMASARAFLRQRAALGGSLAEVITDVNVQVTRDVRQTGRFMTLLFLRLDRPGRCIRWVRAGHDPAILYDPESDKMETLQGPGIALGLEADFAYTEQQRSDLRMGQILVLGTDGIWEARNAKGEMFGKTGLLQAVRDHRTESADAILRAVFDRVMQFQSAPTPSDDLTLVVVKLLEDL